MLQLQSLFANFLLETDPIATFWNIRELTINGRGGGLSIVKIMAEIMAQI